MPLVLDEDSEFSLVIMVEKEKELDLPSKKYLIYQCEECQRKGFQPSEDTFLVYTEKIDEVERIPKTPTTNPFSNRHENLSFKEILGPDQSPLYDQYSSPATTRSKFDFNFFSPNMFFGKFFDSQKC